MNGRHVSGDLELGRRAPEDDKRILERRGHLPVSYSYLGTKAIPFAQAFLEGFYGQ